MLSADVNVLIYGFDADSAHHDSAAALLARVMAGPEVALIFRSVAAGFVRVVTDRRILQNPASPAEATAFLDALLTPSHVRCSEGSADLWPDLRSLLTRYGLRGADVTDALLAASAIRAGVTWYSYDRGFARFSELMWIDPADVR